MKRIVIVAILILGTSLVACGKEESGRAVPREVDRSSLSRRAAPDFTLTDLHGNSLALSGFQGKVVLLDFWATWCPPCRQELPHFKELYAAYENQGLEMIGVSLDQGGEETVRPFVQKNGIRYPIAMGDAQVIKAYGGIRGIPTTFLIDRKGRIAAKFVGYRPKEVFEKEIKALLAES